MAQASMPPVWEARSIFGRLGYSISGGGLDMLAERRWRTVHVTTLSSRETIECHPVLADGGTETPYRLRCFVAWDDHISALRERFHGIDLPYKWATIGVSSGGGNDYEVVHGMNT